MTSEELLRGVASALEAAGVENVAVRRLSALDGAEGCAVRLLAARVTTLYINGDAEVEQQVRAICKRRRALDEMGLCLSLSKPVWAEWGWKRPDDASDAIFIVNSTNDDFPLPENLDLSEYVSDGYTIYRKCIVDLGA